MEFREVGCEVDASDLCPVVVFSISEVKVLGSATNMIMISEPRRRPDSNIE
jgi:hypothetical protein